MFDVALTHWGFFLRFVRLLQGEKVQFLKTQFSPIARQKPRCRKNPPDSGSDHLAEIAKTIIPSTGVRTLGSNQGYKSYLISLSGFSSSPRPLDTAVPIPQLEFSFSFIYYGYVDSLSWKNREPDLRRILVYFGQDENYFSKILENFEIFTEIR